MGDHEDEFRAFVAGSQRRLVHFAELLVSDRGRAEDLVQEGYVAAYAAWPRIRDGSQESYVRRCIVNRRTDWWRRRSSQEVAVGEPFDNTAPGDRQDEAADVDQRLVVMAALARLTERERAVVALRYYAGLSEAAIAAELSVSPGTVKSTAARALGKLRHDEDLHEGATP